MLSRNPDDTSHHQRTIWWTALYVNPYSPPIQCVSRLPADILPTSALAAQGQGGCFVSARDPVASIRADCDSAVLPQPKFGLDISWDQPST